MSSRVGPDADPFAKFHGSCGGVGKAGAPGDGTVVDATEVAPCVRSQWDAPMIEITNVRYPRPTGVYGS